MSVQSNILLVCYLCRFSSASPGPYNTQLIWLLISKKIFSSETAWPNESKLGRKHPWKVLYKDCSFSSDPSRNMGAIGNSCFFWPNGYRGEDSLEINQSKTRIACGGYAC
jgi:hypothetical protein